jgi:hypothetical protein
MRHTAPTITALAALHLAATAWHGNAHTQLAIALPPAKNAFVLAVIVIGPILAAALIWSRHVRVALWAFFFSMLAAFLFGAYHHYVMVSPDNIHHLPGGDAGAHDSFVASATAIAVLELAGALYGAFCLGRHHTDQVRGVRARVPSM